VAIGGAFATPPPEPDWQIFRIRLWEKTHTEPKFGM